MVEEEEEEKVGFAVGGAPHDGMISSCSGKEKAFFLEEEKEVRVGSVSRALAIRESTSGKCLYGYSDVGVLSMDKLVDTNAEVALTSNLEEEAEKDFV